MRSEKDRVVDVRQVREFAHGVLFEALSREAVRDAAAAVALDEVLRALVAVHHSQVSGVPDTLFLRKT